MTILTEILATGPDATALATTRDLACYVRPLTARERVDAARAAWYATDRAARQAALTARIAARHAALPEPTPVSGGTPRLAASGLTRPVPATRWLDGPRGPLAALASEHARPVVLDARAALTIARLAAEGEAVAARLAGRGHATNARAVAARADRQAALARAASNAGARAVGDTLVSPATTGQPSASDAPKIGRVHNFTPERPVGELGGLSRHVECPRGLTRADKRKERQRLRAEQHATRIQAANNAARQATPDTKPLPAPLAWVARSRD